MSFNATVPLDDLAPRIGGGGPYPKGLASVEVADVEARANDSGWEAVRVTFTNGFAIAKDGSVVEGDDFAARIIGVNLTTALAADKNQIGVEIGVRQIVGLAFAAGLVTDDGTGSVEFPFEDAEDAVAQLQAAVGAPVGITVKHGLDKRDVALPVSERRVQAEVSQIYSLGGLS